jgi:hypothetical protein
MTTVPHQDAARTAPAGAAAGFAFRRRRSQSAFSGTGSPATRERPRSATLRELPVPVLVDHREGLAWLDRTGRELDHRLGQNRADLRTKFKDRTIGSIFHLWFQTRVAMSTMVGPP